ncbi:MAG: FKBP-type peptidyl-prolyl cis-trans isomerase [Bacteroidia bacterium]
MMCRFIKLFTIGFAGLLLTNCRPFHKQDTFTRKQDYWYKLLAFTTNNTHAKPGYAWVDAVFKTQGDSVFYETRNEMQDRFFIKTDTLIKDNIFKRAISFSTEGDSVCVLIKPASFFKQQFKSEVPFFCKNDSSVKIFYKVKRILTSEEYNDIVKTITNKELHEIESYFNSAMDFELAKDSLGFYWVERPVGTGTTIAIAGDQVTLSYEGGFLNGRVIDISPPGFTVNYGTPDQLLKGLNYVIGKLKKGQTTKIILPSQLAFGENGSSNGSVPPFTPMLYKISITDIKTPEADEPLQVKNTK